MSLLNQTDICKELKKLGFLYSKQRINKLVKDGRLNIDANGMIDLDEAVRLIKEINVVSTPGQQLTKSKAKKEKSLARLRELEVLEKEAKLVDKKVAQDTVFKKSRVVRDSLLNIPPRIAPILASMTDQFKIEELLKKEIAEALRELTNEQNGNGNSNQPIV